jgi:hypothetical protein
MHGFMNVKFIIRLLDIPHFVIFTPVAHEPDHNNGFGPLKNEYRTPLLYNVRNVSSVAISLKLRMDVEV